MTTSSKINLKPYRLILEALLSHSSPAKLSGMLANAASNLDDPETRTIIKKYIDELDHLIRYSNSQNISISRHHRFNLDEVQTTIQYVEDVIDSNQSNWELIAVKNGWNNNCSYDDLLEWATEEFGVKALVIAHSDALVDADSYWILWDETGSAKDRTISWTNGSKEISEGAGPFIYDCPLYFFELAPTVVNKKWRNECTKMAKSISDLE